jgi:lysophospholipase L1-like esterase
MSDTGRFIRNVLIKTLLLFLVISGLFALINPMAALGRLSIYNGLVPGRVRLPYGEHPQSDYNLSLFNLDAMFASHEIAGPTAPGEFRVALIGDSSTWGYLLPPDQTMAALINRDDADRVHVYNLGYPTLSVTKDLLMLRYALQYKPDLIIWMITLESLPQATQLDSPILKHNAVAVRQLIDKYKLHADPADPRLITPTFWDRTISGERRELADLARLQLYGFLWAATGVDQSFPAHYDPPQKDLDPDASFNGRLPPLLSSDDLALDVLNAGREMAGNVPMWIVNEPIYVSTGSNSDIRYNFFYPRWAYDQYRDILAQWCRDHSVYYLDAWDKVPAEDFSNSAIHRTPAGETLLADWLEAAIVKDGNVR